jgi:hypothetical protein
VTCPHCCCKGHALAHCHWECQAALEQCTCYIVGRIKDPCPIHFPPSLPDAVEEKIKEIQADYKDLARVATYCGGKIFKNSIEDELRSLVRLAREGK